MELISPPPHHDIYSIEDLKQLINDAKMANRRRASTSSSSRSSASAPSRPVCQVPCRRGADLRL
ncbi:MAG: glutamate synthase-related protein [Bifidobacterium bifidum]